MLYRANVFVRQKPNLSRRPKKTNDSFLPRAKRCSSISLSTRNRRAESCSGCSMMWCPARHRTFASWRRDSMVSATRIVLSTGSSPTCVFNLFPFLIPCVAHGLLRFFRNGNADNSAYPISSCCKVATLRDITGPAVARSTANVSMVRDVCLD